MVAKFGILSYCPQESMAHLLDKIHFQKGHVSDVSTSAEAVGIDGGELEWIGVSCEMA